MFKPNFALVILYCFSYRDFHKFYLLWATPRPTNCRSGPTLASLIFRRVRDITHAQVCIYILIIMKGKIRVAIKVATKTSQTQALP